MIRGIIFDCFGVLYRGSLTHLAELADYLDIDGNLLVTNDPYLGATAKGGIISFAEAPEKTGLRVKQRA